MSRETYMMESLTRDLVLRLMEDKNMGMNEAMSVVYNSKTYNALTNQATGLYFQSPIYVYDMLSEELEVRTVS